MAGGEPGERGLPRALLAASVETVGSVDDQTPCLLCRYQADQGDTTVWRTVELTTLAEADHLTAAQIPRRRLRRGDGDLALSLHTRAWVSLGPARRTFSLDRIASKLSPERLARHRLDLAHFALLTGPRFPAEVLSALHSRLPSGAVGRESLSRELAALSLDPEQIPPLDGNERHHFLRGQLDAEMIKPRAHAWRALSESLLLLLTAVSLGCEVTIEQLPSLPPYLEATLPGSFLAQALAAIE